EVRAADGPAKSAAAQSGDYGSRARLLVLRAGRMAHKKTRAAGSVSGTCRVVGPADDDTSHLRRREILGHFEALQFLAIETQVELGGQGIPSWSACRGSSAYRRRLHFRFRGFSEEGYSDCPQTGFDRQAHFKGALIPPAIVHLYAERIFRIDREVVAKCHPTARIEGEVVTDALPARTPFAPRPATPTPLPPF